MCFILKSSLRAYLSRTGVPSTLGFLLRPLGFALLRGLSVVEVSCALPVLVGVGTGDCDNPVGGLGPDNFKVIFKGEVMFRKRFENIVLLFHAI